MVIRNTTTQNRSSPVICADIGAHKELCNISIEEKHLAEILFDYCAGISK